MKKTTLAAVAILAAASIGMPVLAWSQAPAPPSPSASAGPAGSGGTDTMRPGMEHRWGMGRRAMNRSPQQACVDRIARRAGFVAAMGVKLNLTADQKPLWDKLVASTQSAQDNERKLCEALPATADARGKETVVDRLNHRQQMLQAKLQGLQQTGPAVEALYKALTPEQKAMVDHPFRRG
jgi:LTXXQ motif family protein